MGNFLLTFITIIMITFISILTFTYKSIPDYNMILWTFFFETWEIFLGSEEILSCSKNTLLKKIEIRFIIESPYWMLCSPHRKGYSISISLLVAISPIKVIDFVHCSLKHPPIREGKGWNWIKSLGFSFIFPFSWA